MYQKDNDREQVLTKLKGTLRLLLLTYTEAKDIPYLELPDIMEEVISEGYRYWTSLDRYSILYLPYNILIRYSFRPPLISAISSSV